MTESLYGLTLATIAGITVQVYRLPRTHLTYPLYAYLVAQFTFITLCLMARLENWSLASAQYQRLFHASEAMAGVAMLALVWTFGHELSRHDLVICFWTGISLSGTVAYLLRGPWELKASGCFFLACGIVGLLSLSSPAGTLIDVVKFLISFLWLGTGLAWLIYCGLYQRNRADLVYATEKIPVVAALLVFVALSFSLFYHSEFAVQGTPEQVVAERSVAQ